MTPQNRRHVGGQDDPIMSCVPLSDEHSQALMLQRTPWIGHSSMQHFSNRPARACLLQLEVTWLARISHGLHIHIGTAQSCHTLSGHEAQHHAKAECYGCRTVLLSRDGVAKVADVGLARLLTREGAQVSVQGTFEWAAPEVHAFSSCLLFAHDVLTAYEHCL